MNILSSVGSFGFLTLLSRILGYLRDILIAAYLGTGLVADAFFVAFRLPNTFRRLFAEGAFNSAFVPEYSRLDIENKAFDFANSIFNFLIIFLLILICIAEIFMGGVIYLISPGFSNDVEKYELAVLLSRVTFPFLLFVSLSSFYSAILNTKGKFAVAAASPIILNLMLIGSILFGIFFDQKLVFYMAWAVSIAGLIQLLVLIFYTKKYFKPVLKFSFKVSKENNQFFRKLLPSIFSSGVMQINILVGTIIASFQAGAVSYLYYADRIYQLPLAITGIAIGTVILPALSKEIYKKNGTRDFFLQNRSVELSLYLSAPATIGIIIIPELIIATLFGYGSFNEQSIIQTSRALCVFGFGLPAFSLIKIYSNFYFARGDTKFPFYVSVVTILANIFISLSFFSMIGFISIALGTTISCWLGVLIYQFYLFKNNLHKFDMIFKIRFLKIILCSTIMGFFMYFLMFYIDFSINDNLSRKITNLLILVIGSSIIYFVLSVLLKAFSMKDFKLKNYE